MSTRPCPHEMRILDAIERSSPSAQIVAQDASPSSSGSSVSIDDHLAQCPSCRQAVQSWQFMRGLTDSQLDARPLPDAGLIWMKARVTAEIAPEPPRLVRVENTLESINAAMMVLAVVALAAVAGVGWQAVSEAAVWLTGALSPEVGNAVWTEVYLSFTSVDSVSAANVWTLIAAISLIAASIAYPTFAEDD